MKIVEIYVEFCMPIEVIPLDYLIVDVLFEKEIMSSC